MMNMETGVGIRHCPDYRRENIKGNIDLLLRALSWKVRPGTRVLLKPNLISAAGKDGLACTHPEVVAAAAEWFLDHGAKVLVGDSPAFGSLSRVMRACGMTRALRKLPVRLVAFDRAQRVSLANGISVGLATAALECDVLVNLPRIKTHVQLFVTLAIKNYFGTVVGLRKPWCHMLHGGRPRRFAGLLVDLLGVLPAGPTLVDGVVAMQGAGPVRGDPYPLGLLAASLNPVAMDTALLTVLGLEHAKSPVWLECDRRHIRGANPRDVLYPCLTASEVAVADFAEPLHLQPVVFDPFRVVAGAVKRLILSVRS